MAKYVVHMVGRGWDSVIGTENGYGLPGPGFEPRWEEAALFCRTVL